MSPRSSRSRRGRSDRSVDPARDVEHARREAELESDLQYMRTERRRDTVRMVIGILVSIAVSIPVMAMSAHVTDEDIGRVWLWGGLLIGNAGVLASVGWGLHRAIERGEAHW